MTNFSLSTASFNHLDQLVCLEAQIFKRADQFSHRRFRYLIASDNARVLLGWQKTKCVGYGIALKTKLRNGDTKGRIYSIGVLQDMRRHGSGRRLLKGLEKWLIDQNVTFITLETRFGRNASFFERRGYKITDTLQKYYGSVSGLRMRKDIR